MWRVIYNIYRLSSVQSLSHVRLFAALWTAACQASLCITNSWSLLKLTSIESVMPSNHLIPCRPLLLLPSIFPSIRVFSNKSVLPIRWPKYWGFSFNISPPKEHSGLISFRIDRLDFLAENPMRVGDYYFHKRAPEVPSPFHCLGTQWEGAAMSQKRSPHQTARCSAWILDFPASRPTRNKRLLWKSRPRVCCFVLAAQTAQTVCEVTSAIYRGFLSRGLVSTLINTIHGHQEP